MTVGCKHGTNELQRMEGFLRGKRPANAPFALIVSIAGGAHEVRVGLPVLQVSATETNVLMRIMLSRAGGEGSERYMPVLPVYRWHACYQQVHLGDGDKFAKAHHALARRGGRDQSAECHCTSDLLLLHNRSILLLKP
jgi:hypothetical protein